MAALHAVARDWLDWTLSTVALVFWLAWARHLAHRIRWDRRKSAQLKLRTARVPEDVIWHHCRHQALRDCMNLTIRRAEWRRLAHLGIPVDDSKAAI